MEAKRIWSRPFLSPSTPKAMPPSSMPVFWMVRMRSYQTEASAGVKPISVRLGRQSIEKRTRS